MKGNAEIGGKICVLATPRPATPNCKTSLTGIPVLIASTISPLYSNPGKWNDPFELGDGFVAQLSTGAAHFWKLIPPFERPHRVEDSPAVRMVAVVPLVRRHSRVQRGAPATIDDVDVSCRVHPGHHRPKYFFLIRGIDILIDNHDVAAVARRCRSTYRSQARLLGMAGIFLLDGHYGQVGGMIVNADDILNARAFQLVPQNTGRDMQIHLHGPRP